MKKRRTLRNIFTMFTLLFLFCCATVSAAQTVTINLRNATLRQVLNTIEKQTSYRFSYRNFVVDNQRNITVNRKNVAVSAVLDDVLRGKKLRYEIVSPKLIVISDRNEGSSMGVSPPSGNEKITVRGRVIDANGDPVIGATVMEEGEKNGIATDLDGNFLLVVNSNARLTITYVGYKAQTVSVNGNSEIRIVMAEDSQALDELVVVGYGVVKKSDLTGAVGSVHSDDIVAKGATSLMGSLQGEVAGVNISQASSRSGGGFDIQIRGKSTMGDTTSPLYVIDGVVCDNMDFLNPMDIEKVDVLKDASSTAIYGSRATNGVLMITTKKGEGATRTTISYDGYYGFSTVANMPDFMDGTSFMKYRFSRYLKATQNVQTGLTNWEMSEGNFRNLWGGGSEVVQEMYKNRNYTDWPSLVTRDGSQQNHFVNVTGASRTATFRFGLGYQKENGVLYDSYERWNLKGAIDNNFSDKVTAGISMNLSTSMKNFGSKNSINNGFNMTPVMPAYYWEGESAGELIIQPGKDAAIYPDGGGPTSTLNPIVDRMNSKDRTRGYDAMANIYLQYKPIKEIILKTTFSPMFHHDRQGVFYGANTEMRRNQKTNMTEDYHNTNFSYAWDTQANFIKDFDAHSLNLLALFSVYQDKTEGNYIKVVDMPFDVDWNNLGSGTVENQTSYYRKISMISYVFRVNYDYKDRYLLTISSRWDGSSKFSKNNRWGMFPSAAVAWRMTEEPWMKSTVNWLSNLKLRLSYGVTGNNAGVGPYDTQSFANTKYYYNFGSTIANGFGYTMSNADLTWEKTTEFNLGIDFGFFNNQIYGTLDLYNRDSKDLLMEMQTPYEMGSYTGSIVSNVGKVNNKGIEIMLNTVNLKNKNWYWRTTFTFARNLNKIVELNGGKEDLVGNKWFIGSPIDVVYGLKRLGICTHEQAQVIAADANYKTKFYEGEVIMYDRDGNGTINSDDRMILGHQAPTWTGSLVSQLQYRNIDFSFNLYTSQGATVYSPFMSAYTSYSSRGTQHLKMDYYIPEGAPILNDDGTIGKQAITHYGDGITPFPTSTNGNGGGQNWNTSGADASQFFVDPSYIKVKNITVGYTFPKSIVSKLSVNSLRIYVNILNPFVFTDYKGYDPEWATAEINDGNGGVASRTYQIGVNLKF